MAHSIIILDAKLDCVALAYPAVADSANALKAKCDEADIYIKADLESTTESPLHESLELVQTTATDWCDNGTNLSSGEMCGILDGYKDEIERLLP